MVQPPPDSDTESTSDDIGTFVAGIGTGTWWDFEFAGPGQAHGDFRVTLGDPIEIDGETLYEVHSSSSSGDEPPFPITRYRWLGSSSEGLIGSEDGIREWVLVYETPTDFQCPPGFFLDRVVVAGSECQGTNGQNIQLWRQARFDTRDDSGGSYLALVSEKEWFSKRTGLVGYEYDSQVNDGGTRQTEHIKITLTASSLP